MSVFANGQEVSGKASAHKVLASMPDVCLSPPSPPAGPIPIPYPNFAQASDTTDGSKTVKLNGKEIGLKGQSKYKTSKGDEAATRNFGAGLISHTITGAVKHKAGSFNVKAEGCGVVRFMDLTTGNHSNPGDGCMTIDTAKATPPKLPPQTCKEMQDRNTSERERLKKAKRKTSKRAHRGVRRAARGNTTISHAQFFGGGELLKAASKAVVHKYDNAFSGGLTSKEIKERTSKDGTTVSSKACGGHQYKKVDRPHTSHTEARIIEDIFSQTPPPTSGTLVLAINWPGGPKAGKEETSPCEHCEKLICAVTKCLSILICDQKNEPQKPDCPAK